MATAILRTEDCLRNRFRLETLSVDHPLRSRRNPNPKITKPKPNNDFSSSRRRKRSSVVFQSNNGRQSEPMVAKPPGKNLVMGQVKILKRGETLTASPEKTDRGRIQGSRGEEEFDLALGSTNRLGPDPETMQKQIKLKEFKIGGGLYAGSASFFSPPPSSLPVPGFLGKTARASS
ncbi:uncharacterized protein LOC111300428 [Durio zibethinus]|uniref:Uncharacterized protein LOC111300428 n=1 Tax=Durio zibethinus TaxID=66656 RepID=A0A6P5ZG84_DURZI|nr:uncharacterized protein LOC111300428 [Durio zibethinus]